MTAQTIMPFCSITKQMLNAVKISLELDSSTNDGAKNSFTDQLSQQLRQTLHPSLIADTGLTVADLCDNVSGLRDYWAMTVLFGAHPEGKFSMKRHGPQVLERTKSFHFKPGTEYSYCNLNFIIVESLIEKVTGRSLADFLVERVFTPAGMKTAKLHPDTADLPPPCIGYEGTEQTGYYPAKNRIEWSGDAGIVGSLDDFIAYESYIDRCHADPHSWYSVASEPRTYPDGTVSSYGNGLRYGSAGGISYVGHGGALRGFRHYRLYAAEKRVSIAVMFNHEVNAAEAAGYILFKAFERPEPIAPFIDPAPEWVGTFLDPSLQLSISVKQGPSRYLVISYTGRPDVVKLVDSHQAKSSNIATHINGDTLTIQHLDNPRLIEAHRINPHATFPGSALVGTYRCEEIDSNFQCTGQGGMLYGCFEGFLGKGPIHLMRCLGDNVWSLSCARSMDAPAPGDWTMIFHSDESGNVSGFTIDCFLARRLEYTRITRTSI